MNRPDKSGLDTVALYKATVVKKGKTAIGRLDVKRPCVTFSALRYKLLATSPASAPLPPMYIGPYVNIFLLSKKPTQPC